MSDPQAQSHAHDRSIANETNTGNGKPVVVGLPGSGKTFLTNQLQQQLEQGIFASYEGSKVIASLAGGLDAFQKLEHTEKVQWRSSAIEHIREQCAARQQIGAVAGHYMFWPEEEVEGQVICTPSDLETYTHILYLDIPAEVIARRRLRDAERDRPFATATHLLRWKTEEQDQLRQVCREHGILFATISDDSALVDKVAALLYDFRKHDEEHNLQCAARALDEVLNCGKKRRGTILVIDGDRTSRWFEL